MAVLIGIGLLLSVIIPALANGTIEDISSVALEEAGEIRGVTSGNSTVVDKLTDRSNEFYESIEELFVLYGVAPETVIETNGDTYTIGDYEFYFEENEDGYYFIDADGISYYIASSGISQSINSHLSKISEILDRFSSAVEEGKIGRAFGLLTSLEVRMRATSRYMEKDATRTELKEQNKVKLQEKLEEREEMKKGKSNNSKKNQDNNNSKKDNLNKGNSGNASGNGNPGK